MSVEELEKRVNEKAKEFGLKVGERNNSNAVVRSNIQEPSLKEGGAYFGYIRPEEAPSGIYIMTYPLWSFLKRVGLV